jgi:hypothetical protein
VADLHVLEADWTKGALKVDQALNRPDQVPCRAAHVSVGSAPKSGGLDRVPVDLDQAVCGVDQVPSKLAHVPTCRDRGPS